MQKYKKKMYLCILKEEYHPKRNNNMKQRLFIVALAVVLLTSACMRDGDFDELKHPMVFQGDFDPTLGFPVAWADADLGTLMGFVPAGTKFTILADPESGLLTMEKDSIMHTAYTFDSKRGSIGRPAKDGKIVVFRRAIDHGNKIGLEELKKHDMLIKRLDLMFSAYVKAELSGSQDALIASDAEIFFDTIKMTIDFEDGTSFSTPIYWDAHLTAEEMVEGKFLSMPDPYDASYWVNNEAKRVHFQTAINVAVNPESVSSLSVSCLKDELFVDSLVTDMHAIVDFPGILYVGNLHLTDTLEADMSKLDSILKDPSVGNDNLNVSLNDTAENWLYIEADNGLPANLTIQLRGLDSNYEDRTGNLLPEGQFLFAAPVTVVPDDISTGLYEGYMSNGRTPSEFRVRITTDLIRRLAQSKYLELALLATTPTEIPPAGSELKPFVIFRDVDHMKLKVSLQVSPHIYVNIPVGAPLN